MRDCVFVNLIVAMCEYNCNHLNNFTIFSTNFLSCVFELCSSSCKIHKVNLFGISHLSAVSGYVVRYKARSTHTQWYRDFKSLLGILII